jgi:hypothetical protein
LYVTVSPLSVAILRHKPKAARASGPCESFQQARTAAIDLLVVAIEDAERMLADCKRATRIDDLCR